MTNLRYEHMDLLKALQAEQDARTDGCTCNVVMFNTGTSDMFTSYDTDGCPLHCEHRGISRSSRKGEWWCSCGASHEDHQ